MKSIEINGESIPTGKAKRLIKMLYNDAKQMAGEFHGLNRSEKFRVNWPDAYVFSESEWRNFVAPTRLMYTELLANPLTPESQKHDVHLALVLERMISKDQETDNRLQIHRDTQNFWGDKYENNKTIEKFGKAPNLRAYLRRSTVSPTQH